LALFAISKILIFADINKIENPKKHLFYWESRYYGMDSIKYLKPKAQ
jgi:hypothetical protein